MKLQSLSYLICQSYSFPLCLLFEEEEISENTERLEKDCLGSWTISEAPPLLCKEVNVGATTKSLLCL